MKNTTLRIIWILPNIFCYIMFIGTIIFVVNNKDGLVEIHRLSIWVLFLIVLFIVSIFGTYRIFQWIKEDKL